MLHVFTALLLMVSTSLSGTPGEENLISDSVPMDEDSDDTGEVDEDIIIMDEEDTNDDEGVTEGR